MSNKPSCAAVVLVSLHFLEILMYLVHCHDIDAISWPVWSVLSSLASACNNY